MLVQGPYLVRGASIEMSNLALYGDIDGPTNVTVFTSKQVRSITWNGKPVRALKEVGGGLVARIGRPTMNLTLPTITGWKSMDSLPEKQINYDDSGPAWKVANKTTTPNPTKPFSIPFIYVDDYGFHTGTSLFRTNISGSPAAITLDLQGGTAFGFSVFLNSRHIGSYLGNVSYEAYNMTLTIPLTVLQPDQKDNVLLVVMDNNGHDELAAALNPRGILLAGVTDGTFGTWKIAGNAGGESNIDPIRGPLAEGGLTGERLGWHLPGFDDSGWPSTSPSTGVLGAGVTFYRTTANLSIPVGLDASIIFTLNVPSNSTAKLRANLWVNGFLYGLFNPYIGNQVDFPVPPGILNYNGVNTIAISVWSQDDTQAARVDVGWETVYVHESGYDFEFDARALRPGWVESRLKYA